MIDIKSMDVTKLDHIEKFLKERKGHEKVPKRKTKLLALFTEELLKSETCLALDKIGIFYKKKQKKSDLEELLFSNLILKIIEDPVTPSTSKRSLNNLVSPETPRQNKASKKHFSFDKTFIPDWEEVLKPSKDPLEPPPESSESTKAQYRVFRGITDVDYEEGHFSLKSPKRTDAKGGYCEVVEKASEVIKENVSKVVVNSNETYDLSKDEKDNESNDCNECKNPADFASVLSSYLKSAEEKGSELVKKQKEKNTVQKTKSAGKLQICIGRTDVVTVEKNVQKFVIVLDIKEVKRNIVFWCYNGDYMKEVFDIFGRFKNKDVYQNCVLSLYRYDNENEDEIMVTQTNYKLKGVCICVTCKGSIQVAERKYREMNKEIIEMMTHSSFFTMYKTAIDGYYKKLTGTSSTQNRFQDILVKNYENKNDFYWLTDPKYYSVKDMTPVKLTDYFRDCDIKRFIQDQMMTSSDIFV